MRLFPLIAAALALGCSTHRVEIAVPAQPAVALQSSRVAVVAEPRRCREVANALVRELEQAGGFSVDPMAAVQLRVTDCGRSISGPQVRVVQRVGAAGQTTEQRSVRIDGRAHAALVVRHGSQLLGHLIGAGQQHSLRDAAEGLSTRRLHRELNELLAEDLAEQLRPVPRLTVRRLYPNAPPGSAQELLHQAVNAELSGDLLSARALVREAIAQRPSPRAAAYLRDLERRAPPSSN